MQHGFIKVASAIPATKVADCRFNTQEINRLIHHASRQGVEIICFPELAVTGYSCADIFAQQLLLQRAEDAVAWLLQETADTDTIAIVGAPVAVGDLLLNAAVVIQQGHILGIVPKTFLPNYKEFYEQRWFASATQVTDTAVDFAGQTDVPLSANLLFAYGNARFAIELCEDLWAPIPPASLLALHGAELIFNLSASNELIAKNAYLHSLIAQQSARTLTGYIYSSCGFGESTQDVVYGGNALIYENGTLLAASERFSFTPQLIISEIDTEQLQQERRVNTTFRASQSLHTLQPRIVRTTACLHDATPFRLSRPVNPHPFVPAGAALDERCEEIFSIQVAALAKRIVHTNARSLVVGISGGLDSTLALLVCVRAIDKLQRPRTDIVGITMPGFGTTNRTYHNALSLMQSLGITIREISIRNACLQHFSDIGHDPAQHDITYENVQARERTQILMDVANQTNGFVVGTGDLSELALGWCTYNADHMSNYSVNCSIPKTLVRHLVKWVACSGDIDPASQHSLLDIVDTPISPELLPADADGNIAQKTEDLVGPYELHDFFLYYFLRHGFRPRKIYFLALQAFGNTPATPSQPQSEPVTHYDATTIHHWLTTFCRRFFTQQFKRSCMPDGPKVGSVSLSPRGDWRMPSDASYALWVEECETLQP